MAPKRKRFGHPQSRNGKVSLDSSTFYVDFKARVPEYEAAFASFLNQAYSAEIRELREKLSSNSTTTNQSQPPPLSTITSPFGPITSHNKVTQTSSFSSSESSSSSQQFSLRICAQALIDYNPSLATLLFRHPEKFLSIFHNALVYQVRQSTISQSQSISKPSLLMLPTRLSQKLKVRVEYLPPIDQLCKASISMIRSGDLKKLIQIAGTVVRTGMIKMQEVSRDFQCQSSKCHHRFTVSSDPEQGHTVDFPKVCPSERNGGKPCKSTSFLEVQGSRLVSDFQVIKIQEQASKLGVGSIPRAILVILDDDLVDSVKAGDQVVIVGILLRCWKPCIKDVRCDLETMIKANSIRIKNATASNVLLTEELKKEFQTFWKRHEATPLTARNEIVASICPKVYGLFIVKLAVALTVIGGCPYVDENGMKTRGEPHMLLIGDPGTGKSQFLRFTAELSPRSVLTTGIGTTSAGLTCTAVKDGGEWMLEAGALVLADRGICCIDEFSSIRSHDRTSIHEAMEQQTLSVAKAGLVCKLNARTTIFAVTNPKGRYDPQADVSVNTAIASPLLSRFDIILVLLDTVNSHWDQVVSSFILQQSTGDESTNTKTAVPTPQEEEAAAHCQKDPSSHTTASSSPSPDSSSRVWSIAKLQAYICYVKGKYTPRLSGQAMSVLQAYYQRQRRSDGRSAARTTIRLLESLTRLAQAHARLLCHDEVQVQDAVVAVFVMEMSQSTDGMGMGGSGIHSALYADFAEDPEMEYIVQEKMILTQLGLQGLATCSHSQSQYSQAIPPPPPPPQGYSRSQDRHATTSTTHLYGYHDDDDYCEEEPPMDEYMRMNMRMQAEERGNSRTGVKDEEKGSSFSWKDARKKFSEGEGLGEGERKSGW